MIQIFFAGLRYNRSELMMRRIMFGSCYVYSPAGANGASALSRLLRALLKEGDARLLDKCALRVRQQVHDRSPLAAFFGMTG